MRIFTLIVSLLAASLSVLYVGFFAYSINAIPLTIITVFCLGLMLYSTYEDIRDSWTNN